MVLGSGQGWKADAESGYCQRLEVPLPQRQNVLRIDSEEWNMMQERYEQQLRKQEALLNRKNEKTDFYNGIYDRWKYPVLTR